MHKKLTCCTCSYWLHKKYVYTVGDISVISALSAAAIAVRIELRLLRIFHISAANSS